MLHTYFQSPAQRQALLRRVLVSGRIGMTFIEILLSILILAMAIIPISDFLGRSAVGTLFERSEADAMQYACDKMDSILMSEGFESVVSQAEDVPPITDGPPGTDLKMTVEVFPLGLGGPDLPLFNIPDVVWHGICPNGVEGNACGAPGVFAPLDADPKVKLAQPLDFLQLDKEKLTASGASQCLLKDVKLTIRWKPRNAPDRDYDRHPIILISRKARL